LIELAAVEPNMVAITPATAEGSGLVKFGKAYPERFYDVAICEQHAVTMAAGLAKAGLLPVVSIYSTFLQRAVDQVIHDVAILNLPVIFGIDRGGLVEDGETHQGVFDIAMMRSIPNMRVLAPKDAVELRDMLYTVIRNPQGPVAIRFPRDKAVNSDTYPAMQAIDVERWERLSGSSSDSVTLLAYGSMVEQGRAAVAALADRGISASLVNARSCKPLDDTFLDDLFSDPTRKIVTLEEGCLAGGFGAAVLEWSAQLRSKNPARKQPEIACIGVPDKFVEHGARAILLDINGLSVEKITDFVASFASA
jgi:1-deoxy-D-xylulose-5-phosphate synthase